MCNTIVVKVFVEMGSVEEATMILQNPPNLCGKPISFVYSQNPPKAFRGPPNSALENATGGSSGVDVLSVFSSPSLSSRRNNARCEPHTLHVPLPKENPARCPS
jgi:hypothetical protein